MLGTRSALINREVELIDGVKTVSVVSRELMRSTSIGELSLIVTIAFSDNHQRLCFSLAMWNGKDKILKERLFGLTGGQGG
jgi:hypothetical protein